MKYIRHDAEPFDKVSKTQRCSVCRIDIVPPGWPYEKGFAAGSVYEDNGSFTKSIESDYGFDDCSDLPYEECSKCAGSGEASFTGYDHHYGHSIDGHGECPECNGYGLKRLS